MSCCALRVQLLSARLLGSQGNPNGYLGRFEATPPTNSATFRVFGMALLRCQLHQGALQTLERPLKKLPW